MPEFRDNRLLPFSAQHIYDIVLDIEKYPEFLPWCTRSEIVERFPGDNKLYASVSAGYTLYSETYLSKVTFEENKRIDAHYIEGPFKNLNTIWQFKDHKKGCELDFFVAFEFNKGILNTVAQHMIDQVTEKMVEAFVMRAQHLSGL